MRDEIKQQNFNFNKQMNEINTRCDSIKEQILESVNHKFDEQISEITENLESKINNVNEQMTDQIKIQVEEQCVETVSYTHLDVYKRQV